MNNEDRRRGERRRRHVPVTEERRRGERRREDHEYHRRVQIIRACLLVRAVARKRFGTPDRAMVWLAIAMGWYQRRPLDVSAVAALTGCSRQTVLRHIAALKEQGAVDTRPNTGRTILTPRADHGATRAFFNTVEAAMRRGGNPSHMSETDT
jgi:HTH domain